MIDDAYTWGFSAPNGGPTAAGDGPSPDLQFVHRGSHGINGGRPISAARPDSGWTVHMAAGLVSARVARVTLTSPSGAVTEVPLQNGRFVARSVQIDGAEPGPKPGDEDLLRFRRENYRLLDQWHQSNRPLIQAYDRDGKLLAKDHAG